MSFDQTWHERRAWKVDHLGARNIHAPCRTGALDAVAFHSNCPTFVKRLAVEDTGGSKHGGRLSGRGQAQEEQAHDERAHVHDLESAGAQAFLDNLSTAA